MTNLKKGAWAFILSAALVTCGTVKADEEETVEMTKMTVTAEGEDSPGIKEIDAEELQRNLAADMKDIFSAEPSIEIGGGSRAAQRIYVRGIEATNLNVTIDGAGQGMNHFQHRGNIGGISPDLLKKVEVQTMPTADQGAGALGGSIKFETVDAQDLLPSGKKAGIILRGGYSSVDNGETLGGSLFGLFGEHAGILLNYSGTTFDPYEDGSGKTVTGSEGEDKSLFFKASLLDINGHSLRLSIENNKDQGLYTGDWTYGDGTSRTPTNQVSERDTYIIDYRYISPGNDLVDMKINGYWNESMLDRSGTETISEGYGVDVRNTSRFSIGGTKHALTFGADRSSETGEEAGDSTDVDVKNTGIYLQDRMTLSRFMFSFGARFDDFDTTFSNINITGNEVSPNAGVELEIGKGFTGFASYGEATRAKGIIPIGWLVDTVENAEVNQVEDKNSYGKDMQPESSETVEYGIRYETSGLFCNSDRFNAHLAFFDTEIENLIVQVGGSRGLPVTGLYNDDPITSKGYEVKLGWGIGAFNTNIGFTHADTEDEDGNAVAFSRRKAASAGDTLVWDSYWHINQDIGLGYTLKYVDSLNRDDISRDGYTLHNIQAVYSPPFIKGLSFTLAVHNLFDEQYSSQASSGEDDTAAPEPGRDIRAGISYRVLF